MINCVFLAFSSMQLSSSIKERHLNTILLKIFYYIYPLPKQNFVVEHDKLRQTPKISFILCFNFHIHFAQIRHIGKVSDYQIYVLSADYN